MLRARRLNLNLVAMAQVGTTKAPFGLFSQEMIDEADRDGDGEINEEEFLRIMKKTSLY